MAKHRSIAQQVAPTPRGPRGAEGIALALKLHAQAVAAFAKTHGLSERAARAQLRRLARAGRVPSKVMDADG
jgi:hypothetical protein